MKNYILALIAISAFLFVPQQKTHAQAALFILIFGDKVASEEFHLSLDAGLNISSLSGYDDGTTFLGPNFGLGTHIKLNERWHLAPEIKFLSKKGVKDADVPITIPAEFQDSETTSRIVLNYIDFPILAQYKFENGLYFSAGPQISFLTDAKQETDVILADGTTVDVVQDLKDRFMDIDYSFPVEVAYGIKSVRGGKGIDFRLRYTYGLNEVFESNTALSANHSNVQFIITLPFVEPAAE